MVHEHDHDKDNLISFEEFLQTMAVRRALHGSQLLDEDIQKAFKEFDKDDSGRINSK
jgi:Ca2+-binding EF-hand superfamily protein